MLDALGNLGDFIGGIAVVATLIYLAVQVRHNTAALKTASRQEIVEGYRQHNRLFFQPGAYQAYARGLRSWPQVNLDDQNSFDFFGYMLNDHALFFQGVFALHEAGSLEDETYRAYLDWFAGNLSTPGGTAWWQEVGRSLYPRRMVEAVDARLAQGGLPDVLELSVLRLVE